jgi:hypothetical protein
MDFSWPSFSPEKMETERIDSIAASSSFLDNGMHAPLMKFKPTAPAVVRSFWKGILARQHVDCFLMREEQCE